MKTKTQTHTPGPWKMEPGLGNPNDIYAWNIIRPEEPKSDGTVLAIVNPKKGITVKDNEADARLIAAAPDMVRALTSIMFAAEHAAANPDTLTAIKRMARAAIAKAKPKS